MRPFLLHTQQLSFSDPVRHRFLQMLPRRPALGTTTTTATCSQARGLACVLHDEPKTSSMGLVPAECIAHLRYE